jgi:uncharacterized protein
MATDTPKPKPLPDTKDPDIGPFWTGTAAGKLQVKQCGACRRHHWPPRLGCPHCGSDKVAWVAVAPRGQVYSWTVVHRSQTQGFEPEVPYAVVLVALDEAPGVRMVGNLVDMKPDQLAAGSAVEAVFTPAGDGAVTLVNWRPAS